jgi:uncharacterized protein (UPF0261 family)
MKTEPAIAVVGTFDSKADEHLFIEKSIQQRNMRAMTINVGTRGSSPAPVSIDFFTLMQENGSFNFESRDEAIAAMILEAKKKIYQLYQEGQISGIISAGGGTGTHICTSIMHELPLGTPKVMVSTVASRDMAQTVGTKDITMIHSVADLLGVNSISGMILDKAAAGMCAMVQSNWLPDKKKKRIALPFFGFITDGAEATKRALEKLGYEVVAFHANGTGGMAMEELAAEGYFDGILDFATHELADELMHGYCKGIGPQRFEPVPGQTIPRLAVPGGLDCAVLEFTRNTIPHEYKDRKIFFYDFRSAIRLNAEETTFLANQLAEKLNKDSNGAKVLVPNRGWSEADRHNGPLYDPEMNQLFLEKLRELLNPQIEIREADHHINDAGFGRIAAMMMDRMVRNVKTNALP